MRRVVVDASALAAIAFGEPRRHSVADRLDHAIVCAPRFLQLELANVAWKKLRQRPDLAAEILQSLAGALDERAGIDWYDVNPSDAALVAMALGCTAYDAAYVWLAGSLGADLVTEDARLARLTASITA
jgi:predicted nucleic acid-binding protein